MTRLSFFVWLSLCFICGGLESMSVALAQQPAPNVTAPKGGEDPLAPYLDGLPPKILREVAPSRPVPEDVTVNPTVFELNGSEVFAFIARPKAPGKYPGILIFHGSGGGAEVSRAMYWAQRGYVAVAPDLPGVAAPKSLIHTRGRWNDLTSFDERYNVTPSIQNCLVFDAVTSGMKALYLLRSQPDVDPSRIGVVGISYGGYMTCMVSALAGDLVHAAFSVYGCGFFEHASPGGEGLARLSQTDREFWLRWLDAGRRLGGLKAPLFIAAATNDFFFYPNAVQTTLDHIAGARNHVYAPNANHTVPVPGGSTIQPAAKPPALGVSSPGQGAVRPALGTYVDMETPYFDYHLKGQGTAFPVVTVEASPNERTARFRVASQDSVESAAVYWAGTDPNIIKRNWSQVAATRTADGIYEAQIPEDAVDWFALVSDVRPVSVSSRLVHIPKTSAPPVASSPAEEAFPAEKTDFRGFDRYEISVKAGQPKVIIVCPKAAAPGKPWVWSGSFWGAKLRPELEQTVVANMKMVERGFHWVIAGPPVLLGHPSGNAYLDKVYQELTTRYGFSRKPALVGLSREGLGVYRWASENADKVACIYLDNGVCDLKSWPGGKGKGKGDRQQWAAALKTYQFDSEEEAVAYNRNPIDLLQPLATAGVPLLHVCGDADDVVPLEENSGVVKSRYDALGGKMTLILKKGAGHHPHGLEDPSPIVEFISKNATR